MQQDDSHASFTGRLVSDPEPHYSNDEKRSISVHFTIAHNKFKKGREETQYVDVRVRYKDKLANFLLAYAVAGTHVLVRGSDIRAKVYTPKKGDRKDVPTGILELDAETVKILGKAKGRASCAPSERGEAELTHSHDESELVGHGGDH